MSDLNNNSQNNNINNIDQIKSLKFQSSDTTSLEKINAKLQEIHNNILKENDKIKTNFAEIAPNSNKQITNNNIETENQNVNTENNENILSEKRGSENLTERDVSNIVKINEIRKTDQHRNDLENFRYKNLDDLSESIIPIQSNNDLNNYKVSSTSLVFLNSFLNVLKSDNNISKSIKENKDPNESEKNSYNNEVQDCQSLVKIVNDSENINSLRSDSYTKTEEINFRLTNLPEDKKNISKDASQLTNELNKACIRTIDNIKSKDNISNLDCENSPIEYENEINDKENINISQEERMTIEKKKNNLEMLFQQEPKKDENEVIEDDKNEIYNEIDNVYNIQLNLVKINNKEQYSLISKYNDVEKDQYDYDKEYFFADKNDINFLNRRNSFLNGKYFSYIFNKQKNNEKEKNNSNDEGDVNIEDIKINIFDDDQIKKYKKNYDEEIDPVVIDLNYIRDNFQHENIKKYKIHDIENMPSFFYNFHLYSPEEGFKKIIDEKTEKLIIDSFTAYRNVLNDGNSFKRCFSYLLLETYILQNKIKQLDFLIYDIKNSLKEKFSDIQRICNVLIDIKENSSIDYLMNSYNNQSLNFDEIMITYIEDTVNNILDIKENKYQEIDLDFMKIISNVFSIDLEIYYIEKEKKTDEEEKFLKMNKYVINCEESLKNKNQKLESNSHEIKIPTFRFLFFLNSFYIVYTKQCDIDSTLANNNLERQYYYLPSLPKYKCPNCNKQTPLDIIPQYEALFCHICLEKYLKEILEKRIKIYVESNFSCIEYYTKPININSNIQINFSLYKYITGNYITDDFENLLNSFCFKCLTFIPAKKSNKSNEIKKLNCHCQICTNCIEEIIKENTKGKSYLNKYELNTIKRTKCLCGKDVDLKNLFECSKNKPTKRDIEKSKKRLIEIINGRCCLCKEKDPLKIFKFAIVDGPFHFMCINCHEKELKKNDKSEKSEDNNNFTSKIQRANNNYISSKDLTSSDTGLKNNNFNEEQNKKFFCKICFEEHIWSPNNMQDIIGKVSNNGKQNSCCGGKCLIF